LLLGASRRSDRHRLRCDRRLEGARDRSGSASLTLAVQILESKVADFDPRSFRDRYAEALLAHLKAKQAGTIQQASRPFPRRGG
jgi:non-homologous end joining protein Ku